MCFAVAYPQIQLNDALVKKVHGRLMPMIECNFCSLSVLLTSLCPGSMHAGYPVMANSAVAADLVGPRDARTKDMWGPIHELGHNQQRSRWEFPPHTTECTCNLWSVYVHEEVLGISREEVELVS